MYIYGHSHVPMIVTRVPLSIISRDLLLFFGLATSKLVV